MKLFRQLLHEPQGQFERDFALEVLNSEKTRASILAALFGCILVGSFSLNLIFGGGTDIAAQGRYWGFIIQATAVAYELATRHFFGVFIRIGRQPPTIARYGNAFFETSLPTIVVGVLANYIDPVQALMTPLSYFYFAFILLATLRLDFKLCFFTGIVAAVEYFGLVMIYIDRLPPFTAETLSTSLPMQFVKCLTFIGAGAIAGVISSEIRKHFANSVHTMEERNRVIQMFGQHVSPAVVNKLLAQKADLEMESEMRFVCLMFLDIRNFTAFSENKSPEEVVNYLNTLFESMIDSVNRHHGIINKFLGDGFMAVFGAPVSEGQDCKDAVAASLEMIEQVEKLSASGRISPTRIGIGLHAGQAVTGNVGSPLRKEYTIIGDTVNLASRIEQLNKQFSSQLLISETVWDSLDQSVLEATALEPILVKGRQAPVQIFKLA